MTYSKKLLQSAIDSIMKNIASFERNITKYKQMKVIEKDETKKKSLEHSIEFTEQAIVENKRRLADYKSGLEILNGANS